MAEVEEDEISAVVSTTLTALPSHYDVRDPKKLRQRRSKSLGSGSISLKTLGIQNGEGSFESLPDAVQNVVFKTSYSAVDILGPEINEDAFQKEVVQKTQSSMVGRQEAETEVVLDRLIQREGSKDKALLYVVSELFTELKVQLFVNTLLHRGANPSYCDNKWQTPLHHAVRRGFKGVVSKLLEHDALPQVRDKNKKMPLHLAIDAGYDEIASMLLDYMPNLAVRELFVAQANKEAECSLHQILERQMQQTALSVLDCMVDKIGQTSHVRVYYHVLEADDKGRPPTHPDFDPNSRSCLHLISKGYKDVVYHFVVRLLIRRKWKSFARFRFQLNFFIFLLTLFALTFSAVVGVTPKDPAVYDTPLQITRAVFEVWSVGAVLLTFILELNQFRKHRLDYWRDQFNWIDVSSSALLLTVLPLRFAHVQAQWIVFSFGYLLWTLRVFKYGAVFRQTGAYAQVLWRIISHDFLQFIVLFLVILLTFSGSFVLALKGENSLHIYEETSNFWQILFTGVRILIEGQRVVDYYGPNGYKVISCILMVAFLFICCVVLLNILIAQLSDTYQNVQKDAHRGLELNRAWIIARVERNSIFFGKGYRVSKYVEMEELNNALTTLEKWDSPLLNEMNKNIREVQESMVNTQLNMQTIKNRLSRQEYALKRIQDQLEMLIETQKPKSSRQSRNTSDLPSETNQNTAGPHAQDS